MSASASSGDRGIGSVGGAVDWSFAADIGAKLSRPGPVTTDYTRDQAIAQLYESARTGSSAVREVTHLNEGAEVPEARVIDRKQWVRAATRSMRVMTGGTEQTSKGPAGALTAKVTGAQTGGVLAFISSGILGQYDPFGVDGGELLLVYPNVIAVERQLRVRPADFRLWVCLHEVTHRVQFRANPWLAEHMSSSLAVLTNDGGEQVGDVVGRLGEYVRAQRSGKPVDANSAGVLGLLRAVQARAATRGAGPAAGAGHPAGGARRACDGRRRARGGADGGDHPPPVRRTAATQTATAATHHPHPAGFRRQARSVHPGQGVRR